MNNDHKTNIAGAILAMLLASGLDFPALLSGDKQQMKLAIGSVAIGLFGYFTNKSQPPQKPEGPAA